eukprot:TRINITY_DN81330_c0_g1_i1.p1 TRINITY_DN81330_c0_g1~~TRINITY_DN81330_c0_g1_i1.p1  ORF type:complete len:233 (-),score=23.67 TRINITY_DN81330_c0_g1_i1:59-757(-)
MVLTKSMFLDGSSETHHPSASSAALPTLRSAFYLDCSRHGLFDVMNRVQCSQVASKFSKREMMDQMPTDRNCDSIHFILDRSQRQWYKCCSQGFLGGFKCTEVTPSAWYSQRNSSGQSLPFENEKAQECFRSKPPDFYNCPDGICTHSQENCVVLGKMGESSSWPFAGEATLGKSGKLGKLVAKLAPQATPKVNVLHLSMPTQPLLMTLLQQHSHRKHDDLRTFSRRRHDFL